MEQTADALRADVIAALETIFDPCSMVVGHPLGILAMGLLEDLTVGENGSVSLTLLPTSAACTLIASIMERWNSGSPPFPAFRRSQ